MTPILAQRARSDRAFERLYRKHVGDVYRYALVVLRNPADAEDVTQTTFLNAYRAYERGECPRSPRNWLIAIAHNVCRQRFRQTQRRPTEVAFEDDLADTMVEDDRISAEDIRRALGHLGFNQRAALVMRELEGRSYQEIAEILEVSTSAVETLIFRARRALREQLEGGFTCSEAELAISRQLDGRLPRSERGALRAHLRECEDCARFARSQRAQRGALKSLVAIPLPQSLASFFGGGGGAAVSGGGAALGSGFVFKAAAVGAGALLAGGVGYEGVKHGVLPSRSVRAPAQTKAADSLAVTPAATWAAPAKLRTIDQKPYRPRAVKAQSEIHAQTKNATPALTRSSIPTGRAKAKPKAKAHTKTTTPAHVRGRGQVHHKAHPAKPAPRPKKTPPAPRHHQTTHPPRRHEPPPNAGKKDKTPPPPPAPPTTTTGKGHGEAKP